MGWIFLIGPSINTTGGGSLDSGYFGFSSCSVASVNGKIPFDMLFFSNFKMPLTLHLPIKILDFIEVSATVMGPLLDFNLSCIVRPSESSSSIFPSSHNLSHLSRAAWRSFDFEDLDDFWSSNVGITWTAFKAISVSGVSFIHSFMRRVTSSI